LITTQVQKLSLQSVGVGRLEGNVFKFSARSISNNELCLPMMEIALKQVSGLPLLFRHRHPASNESKAIPIFGRSVGGRIENEGDISYLVIEYEIPLNSPDGHVLAEKQLFAEWVTESDKAGNPIGISLAFIKYLEDGIAYWVDVYEASGTHVPACKTCRKLEENEVHELEGDSIMVEDGKKEDEKKRYETLEAQLEKLTKEKKEFEDKLVTAEKARETAEKKVEDIRAENSKFQEQLGKTTVALQALTERLDYAETKKPLVDAVVKHEKRPELEGFYKAQTVEYLQKELKKWESQVNAPAVSSSDGGIGKVMKEIEAKKLDFKIDINKALEQVAPELRKTMLEWYESQGISVEGEKKK